MRIREIERQEQGVVTHSLFSAAIEYIHSPYVRRPRVPSFLYSMGALSAVVVIFIIAVVGAFLYWVYHRYKLQNQQDQFMKWAGNVMRDRADTNSMDNSPFLTEGGKGNSYRKGRRFEADRRSNRSDSTWSESSADEGNISSGNNSGYGSLGSTPSNSRPTTPDILYSANRISAGNKEPPPSVLSTSIEGNGKGMFGYEVETRTDPERNEWELSQDLEMGIPIVRPLKWTQEAVGNPNVKRFTCPKGEEYFKSINFFVINLTSADVRGTALLNELVLFYKQEVQRQEDVILRKQSVIPEGKTKYGLSGPKVLFSSTGKRSFSDVKSQVMIGLHGRGNLYGHIVTCTFSAVAFDRYRGFISFVFEKFSHMSEKRKLQNNVSPPRPAGNNDTGVGVGRRSVSQNQPPPDDDALPPSTEFPSLQRREIEQRFSRPSSEFVGMSL